MEIGSPNGHNSTTLTGDAENRDPQKTRQEDERGEEPFLLPGDVSRRILGTDPEGTSRISEIQERAASTAAQRKTLVASGLLPQIEFPKPSSIDARGTEHAVRFRGERVEKHQRAEAWVPVLTPQGKLGLCRALPTEYLRRLDLQNQMFGDDIRVTALTRAHRFVTTQPTLRGGEPSENEIRDVLEAAGWERVPPQLQDLPIQLMGSAWWHDQEQLVLLDARKPNFKKTEFGALPIDLILADLSDEMKALFREPTAASSGK